MLSGAEKKSFIHAAKYKTLSLRGASEPASLVKKLVIKRILIEFQLDFWSFLNHCEVSLFTHNCQFLCGSKNNRASLTQ